MARAFLFTIQLRFLVKFWFNTGGRRDFVGGSAETRGEMVVRDAKIYRV